MPGIILTDEQKQEVLKGKMEAFQAGLKKLEDETGLSIGIQSAFILKPKQDAIQQTKKS